jgi:RimJ/RimL family protein N-acetyltransferase
VDELSLEEFHERCAAAGCQFADFDNVELFLWLMKADEVPLGQISLGNISRRMLTAEIGYRVAPEVRGNGYATEALRLVTLKAFRESPLRKLIAYVHEENLASRRVLEKVGYRAEGILREHYIVNGASANEVIYGVLRRESVNAGRTRV